MPHSRSRSWSLSSIEDELIRLRCKLRRALEKRMDLEEQRTKNARKTKKGHHLTLNHNTTWGKYGVISEMDLFAKHAEFSAWLTEVKHVAGETLSKLEERELFREYCFVDLFFMNRYVEDYNTATLPEIRYYDLPRAERQTVQSKMGSDEDDLRRRVEERGRMEEQRKEQEKVEMFKNALKHEREKEIKKREIRSTFNK